MSWLDDIIEKGISLGKDTCDPPWTVGYDWPLKGKPPNVVSTAPVGGDEMVLAAPSNPLCADWYTREYIHTSPSTGQTMSVAKWWNKSTNVTYWTATASTMVSLQTNFPELYALLAPLPKDAPVAEGIGDEYSAIGEGDIEEYIELIGSKDPDVPPEAKPSITDKLSRAGFQWWHGALIVAGLLIAGSVLSKKKKRGKLKRRKSKSVMRRKRR